MRQVCVVLLRAGRGQIWQRRAAKKTEFDSLMWLGHFGGHWIETELAAEGLLQVLSDLVEWPNVGHIPAARSILKETQCQTPTSIPCRSTI